MVIVLNAVELWCGIMALTKKSVIVPGANRNFLVYWGGCKIMLSTNMLQAIIVFGTIFLSVLVCWIIVMCEKRREKISYPTQDHIEEGHYQEQKTTYDVYLRCKNCGLEYRYTVERGRNWKTYCMCSNCNTTSKLSFVENADERDYKVWLSDFEKYENLSSGF